MRITTPRPLAPSHPWPTGEQLERMGLVRCQTDGCRVYLDPVNVPQRQCGAHQREERSRRRAERFHHRARVAA